MPRRFGPSTPDSSLDESSSRREFLRRTVGAAGAVGLASTAGCLGNLRDDVSPPPSAAAGTAATAETALSADEFDAFVERQRDRYGDSGVWGIAGTEPDHDLRFDGAWTGTVGLGSDGEPRPQPDETGDLRAVVDAAVAAYTAPEGDGSGEERYQLWLWAAGRLTGGEGGGALTRTSALRRLEVGVTLDGDGAEMGPYTPGSDLTEGPASIGPSAMGIGGPSTSFPIHSGTVRVAPERTSFDENAVAVQWRGDTDRTQSVNGTCAASWAADSGPSFDLSTRVAADRRRF